MIVDRNYFIETFPAISCRRPSLHDLAVTLWSSEQAYRLINVDNWTDLIDLDLEGFGRSGFGAILYLMEADMLWAFLPAWLVIGLEQRSNFENVVPVAVALLNPHQISVEEVDRFKHITEKANLSQKLAISAAILELADLHYQGQPDSQVEMAAISDYWKQSSLMP
jgi:hypothetical protein